MRPHLFLICVIFFTSINIFASSDSTKNNINLSAGMNGSWWRYNRGIRQGWDRSDFVPYYNVDLAYHRKIKSYELGLIFSYGAMKETMIEEFNDVPGNRAFGRVSDSFIQFYSIGVEGLKQLINSKRYHLLVGAGLGTFGIDTSYEFADEFGTKIYWNAFVKHQFLIKNNYHFSFKISYEKKHIFVPDGIEDEHHEFIRMGASIGIEKYF